MESNGTLSTEENIVARVFLNFFIILLVLYAALLSRKEKSLLVLQLKRL